MRRKFSNWLNDVRLRAAVRFANSVISRWSHVGWLQVFRLVRALSKQPQHVVDDSAKLFHRLRRLVATRPNAYAQYQNLLIGVMEVARKNPQVLAELGTIPPHKVKATLADALLKLDFTDRAFREAQERSQIRELYLAEIFPGIEDVSLPIGAVNEESGHANAVDLLFVSAMARSRGAKTPFEIGTYMGRTTYHLTFASDDAVVTTVNLPPEADPAWGPFQQIYFKGRDREAQIRQVWADSTTLDTAPFRQQMDFVFVDANHNYDAVKADTERAFEVLKPGGMIVWHDYAAKSPGVYKFFEEFTQKTPVFRIRKTCLVAYIDGVDPMSFEPIPMRASKEQRYFKKQLMKKKAA